MKLLLGCGVDWGWDVDCCDVGVWGPYILLNGLDDINEDEDVGGGVIWEDCLLNKLPRDFAI